MAVDPVWFAVEQIRRILDGLGWRVTATDTSGDMMRLTIEKEKPKPT